MTRFCHETVCNNTHTKPVFHIARDGLSVEMLQTAGGSSTITRQGDGQRSIEPEETINTVMPMPEDESTWADLNVMFATASGNVRRNNLSDFTNIKRNGKIAMKLQEGDDLVGVLPCGDNDVLMASRNGKAIPLRQCSACIQRP